MLWRVNSGDIWWSKVSLHLWPHIIVNGVFGLWGSIEKGRLKNYVCHQISWVLQHSFWFSALHTQANKIAKNCDVISMSNRKEAMKHA